MAKLKLGPLVDDKPVKLTVELPAAVHRDLIAYAEVLSRETGQDASAAQIIAPMLARFMVTDRGFAKLRKEQAKATEKKAGKSITARA
ncbi:DUF2274 domain-containing protein [Aestuariibius insulae]|uniref:DUF2274 domain-containing protein n=1 Tax=Aestuariibius insulae TaxID=2058287 RepID=UPI00345E1396